MTALLAPILQEFFTAHLVTQRAVSAATIRAYRDTWKLFLAFLSERENVPAPQARNQPRRRNCGDRIPRLPRG